MTVLIRLEDEKDSRDVEILTREAFWNKYKPGCDEHLLVHKIRKVPAFVRELCFVACENDKIVGNIIYSKAKVISDRNDVFEVLCMGPLGVLPDYQGQGVGSLLMRHSIEKARQMEYKGVIIFGNPMYYHRFGFDGAEKFGIQTSWGDNFDAFMALELCEDGLKDVSGRFYEDEVFKIEADELEVFDKGFPFKEKGPAETPID